MNPVIGKTQGYGIDKQKVQTHSVVRRKIRISEEIDSVYSETSLLH